MSASSDKEPIVTKAKSLKKAGVDSFVRKLKSKVKTCPSVALNVYLMAEPSVAFPFPRPSRLPAANPKNASRAELETEPAPLVSKAWEVPSVGPLPNAAVRMLVLPLVENPAKVPVSKPPLVIAA